MAKGKHEVKKTPAAKKSSAKKTQTKKPRARKNTSTAKKKTGGKNAVKIILLVIVLLVAATAVTGVIAGRSSTIHPNLELNGIPVGGMTVDEAEKALQEGGWEAQDSGSVLVKLPAGYEFTVTADEAGLTMNCREAAEAAYAYGHSGDLISDIMAYFKCIAGRAGTADILGTVNSDAVMSRIDSAVNELNAKLDDGYVVDVEKELLYVVKGADTVQVSPEKVFDLIIDAFKEGKSEVEYPFDAEGDADCDFEEIRDEIYAEAVNAEYDKETHKATESVVGIDLDVKAAEKIFKAAKMGSLVEIPLKVTMPDYTTEQLDKMLFRDCLGKQTTSYSTSGAGRCTNVELSASKINGVILNPGESFSYNDVVGKRTTEAGFKSASAYSGGKVVQEIGGGICQTSSTLYCAVLYANLKVTARDCHHFAVSYLPYGMDATVSWGGPEFKFVNNRDFPIKIVTHCVNKQLTVEIWGTDVDGSYVEITASSGSSSTGISATTYRCVYDKDGNLISRTFEASSFYHYHTEDPEPTPTPTPTPSDEPQPTDEPTPTEEPVPTDVPDEPSDPLDP